MQPIQQRLSDGRAVMLTAVLGCIAMLMAGPSFAGSPVTNAVCPVTADEPVDAEVYTDYQGQRVYFCCQRCRRKFVQDPEPYREDLAIVMASAESANLATEGPAIGAVEGENAPGHHEEDGHSHDHETSGHGDEDRAHPEADEGSTGHDHEHDHGEAPAGLLSRLIAWLGKFHPMTVHFPIALLMAAATAEALRMVTKKDHFASAAQFCAVFGGLTALVAAVLGWFFGGFRLVDDEWIMTTHRWLGTGTALWAVTVAGLCIRSYRSEDKPRRRLYLTTLFVGAALVGATSFFGGALIYGIDHLSW